MISDVLSSLRDPIVDKLQTDVFRVNSLFSRVKGSTALESAHVVRLAFFAAAKQRSSLLRKPSLCVVLNRKAFARQLKQAISAASALAASCFCCTERANLRISRFGLKGPPTDSVEWF